MVSALAGLVIIILILLYSSQRIEKERIDKDHRKEIQLLDRLRSNPKLNYNYNRAQDIVSILESLLRQSYYDKFKMSQTKESYSKIFFTKIDSVDLGIEGSGFIKSETNLIVLLFPKEHVIDVSIRLKKGDRKEKKSLIIGNEEECSEKAEDIMSHIENILIRFY